MSFKINSNPARGIQSSGLSGNQWTTACWYRRNSSANGTIVRSGGLSADMQSTANGADVRMMETNGFHGSDGVFTVSADEWVYVAVGGNITTYWGYAWRDEVTENRTSLGTNAPGGNLTAPTYCIVGGSSALSPYNSPAVGEFVHFRHWNAVLTLEELELERKSPVAVRTANLVVDVALSSKTDTGTLTMAGTVDTNYETGTGYPISVGAGASVDVTGLSDATLNSGQTGVVVTGTGFGASQGSGQVIISPTDNVNDSNAVLQTVTSWGDTSITMTAVQKHLAVNVPYYLFVKTDGAVSNDAGFSVMFKFVGPITPRTVARAQAATLAGTGSVTP